MLRTAGRHAGIRLRQRLWGPCATTVFCGRPRPPLHWDAASRAAKWRRGCRTGAGVVVRWEYDTRSGSRVSSPARSCSCSASTRAGGAEGDEGSRKEMSAEQRGLLDEARRMTRRVPVRASPCVDCHASLSTLRRLRADGPSAPLTLLRLLRCGYRLRSQARSCAR